MIQSIRTSIENRLDAPIEDFVPVSGGDINQAFKATVSGGKPYFVKYNLYPQGQKMLEEEAVALRTLDRVGTKVPLVIDQFGDQSNGSVLILEWINRGKHSHNSEVSGGHQLAQQHLKTSEMFGWESDNFIATIGQVNTKCENWPKFYIEYRVRALITKCFDKGVLPKTYLNTPDKLRNYMELNCPKEPPSLIHGDLWGGNVLTSSAGQYYFIDPAVCYANREMDLAMSQLFGGFSSSFYNAYNDVYPIATGYADRIELYQLYYLLVHLLLFGKSYLRSVVSAIDKYCKGAV